MVTPLVQLLHVGKSFGATRVLDDVSLELFPGEVHLLAGENGAGKSTLIKVLGGIHTEYAGEIRLQGQPVRFSSPLEANRHGVSVIHQEMSLVDAMSVVDNIFLGRERTRGAGVLLDRAAQIDRALSVCNELDLNFTAADLERTVEAFPTSTRNRIEIAKALSFEARVLVMDEPTSALNRHEVERLFTLIESLKRRGCGIIYISHKMEEIYRIADRITVLRDGRWVGTAPARECPPDRLIHWMIGREMSQQFPARAAVRQSPTPALELRSVSVPHVIPDRPAVVNAASLRVYPGEIVGLAGLQGAGCSELFQAIFGAGTRPSAGEIVIHGETFVPYAPSAAMRRGLAYLTGDRKATGLVLGMSTVDNVTLAALPELSPGGWLRPDLERSRAEATAAALGVRAGSLEQPVGTLSGGNQQKVALAKWIETHPKVLLLEEPTRGVDVGAKHEIYGLMNRWTENGMAILMISTELPELLGICDRILVMHRGVLAAEFDRTDATAPGVMAAAMGETAGEAGGRA